MKITSAGVLAAGEGSRLKRDGWTVAKPLVTVRGETLLERVLGNIQAADLKRATIIFNDEEKECARFARERFPDLDLDIVVRTTASSYESYRTIAPRLPEGPALVSTVDAFCRRADFLAFVEAARDHREDEIVLAVTRFVEDERPLWVDFDGAGRVTRLGGQAGDAVTAGIYIFPEHVRRLSEPEGFGRLREYLAWLVSSGQRVRAIPISTVVDVDRAADVAAAEKLARGGEPRLGLATTSRPAPRIAENSNRDGRSLSKSYPRRCWGIYREIAHSPGRETDDAQILRATAGALARRGFEVEVKSPDELPETEGAQGVPPFLFVMCEREPVVRRLTAWERHGVRVVNRPAAIRNTDRERALPLFSADGVPFPASTLVATDAREQARAFSTPCWVKRADVHATQAGDVSFAASPAELAGSLAAMSARGIPRAVVQEHVAGDLIKFYGVVGGEEEGPSWFQWFYHRDQKLENHPFDQVELQEAVARAAAALGLEVFGGDAIATPKGRIVLIDLNAWPSFALYRETAAEKIAEHLAARFQLSTLDSRLSVGTQWSV